MNRGPLSPQSQNLVVLRGISPPFGRLSPSPRQIIHALLTRAPLYRGCPFLVRLACVRRAANVRSEPGSNSPVKTLINSPRGPSIDLLGSQSWTKTAMLLVADSNESDFIFFVSRRSTVSTSISLTRCRVSRPCRRLCRCLLTCNQVFKDRPSCGAALSSVSPTVSSAGRRFYSVRARCQQLFQSSSPLRTAFRGGR